MVVLLAFHGTKTVNVPSILEHGLLARRPFEHNWKDASGLDTQPPGVYCFLLAAACRRRDGWGAFLTSYDGDETSLAIDVLGLPLKRDFELSQSSVVLCDIEPERIRVVDFELYELLIKDQMEGEDDKAEPIDNLADYGRDAAYVLDAYYRRS